MDLKDDREFLNKLTGAIKSLETQAKDFEYYKNRNSELEVTIRTLAFKVTKLERIEKKYHLLSENSNIEICRECDGEGGFYFDMGEAGCETDICNICASNGFIEKIERPTGLISNFSIDNE